MDNTKTQTTLSYIWLTDHRSELGTGATCSVFSALHKHTGRKVAVKVIKKDLKPLFLGYTQKEVELIRSFNHRNIIKFIGEEEVRHAEAGGAGTRVVILELCDGGTVHKLLQEAANRFGLPDDVVLAVLRDITEALKYLQTKRIIHRDIKSDNILIAYSDTGEHVYKLTDFGGAHQSESEVGPEEFRSVFGTIELMHPDVLEKGAINKNKDVTFDVGVDLWSFGVVLYQMCTRRFPFVPFRGRADKDTLYRIVSQKTSGDISGCDDETGNITWNKALPNTCQLSISLKSTLTPLIARMLERSSYSQIKREELFELVANIPDLCVPVFYVERASYDKVPVATGSSMDGFALAIQGCSTISAAQQIIFVGSKLFEPGASSDKSIDSVIKSYNINEENPILVMNNAIPGTLTPIVLCDQIRLEIEDADPELGGVELWKWGRQCVATGYMYGRHITTLVRTLRLDLRVLQVFLASIDETWQQLEAQRRHVCQLMGVTLRYASSMHTQDGGHDCRTRISDTKEETQRLQRDVKKFNQTMDVIHIQLTEATASTTIEESVIVRLSQLENYEKQAKHLLDVTEATTGSLREQRNQRHSHNMRQRRLIEMRLIHRQTLEIEAIFQLVKAQVEKTHSHVMRHFYKFIKWKTKIHDLNKKSEELERSLTQMIGLDMMPSESLTSAHRKTGIQHLDSQRYSLGQLTEDQNIPHRHQATGGASSGRDLGTFDSALSEDRVGRPVQASNPEDMDT